MATKPLMLKGVINVDEEDSAGLLREWRREKQQLEDELRRVRTELGESMAERDKLQRAITILRRQLSPLHHALRAVFGEIELAIGEEDLSRPQPGQAMDGPAIPSANNSDPRWESYKTSFPGVAAQIIDALLAHPQMTYMQLKGLLRRDYNTIKTAAVKLKNAGAIVKEGTMCRLNR
jgi:hypothetical protein